jgi:uncharacterized protein (UPF0332 family)
MPRKLIEVQNINKVYTKCVELSSRVRSTGYQALVVESRSDSASSLLINARVFLDSDTKALLKELERRGVSVSI